jgi:hypothetical protein
MSRVIYSCDEGYELVGRAQLTCDIDERWNGPPPRCEGINFIVTLIFMKGKANIDFNKKYKRV